MKGFISKVSRILSSPNSTTETSGDMPPTSEETLNDATLEGGSQSGQILSGEAKSNAKIVEEKYDKVDCMSQNDEVNVKDGNASETEDKNDKEGNVIAEKSNDEIPDEDRKGNDGDEHEGADAQQEDSEDGQDGDESDESDDGKRKEQDLANQPPIISHSSANFALASINPHIVCSLCNGYFRDPYTITECLHAFCKSCLFFAFQSGFRKCPKCDASLEPDPYREVLSDRTLGALVHKILPELQEKDNRDEIKFYERRGIKRKAELRRNDKQGELDRLDYEKAEQNKREKKMQLPNMVCELIYAIYIMHFVEKM